MTFLFWYLSIGLVCIALAVAIERELLNVQNARALAFISLVLLILWPIFAAWVLGRIFGDWMEWK